MIHLTRCTPSQAFVNALFLASPTFAVCYLLTRFYERHPDAERSR